MLRRNQKLEEGQVPVRKGWRLEGIRRSDMEQMRNVIGGEEDTENVVTQWKAMVEGESWYVWNQVKDQPWKCNQGDWKKPKCGSNENSRSPPRFREQRSCLFEGALFDF